MEHVFLPNHLVNRIFQQARSRPREEICGLVAARSGHPTRCFPVPNVSRDPSRLFSMEPRHQIEAFRKMREQGEDLFAIYHSHPFGPAIPSDTDLEQAGYPEALYLIIAMGEKGALEIRGYRLNKGVEEVELEI